jgi:hypothetical protein
MGLFRDDGGVPGNTGFICYTVGAMGNKLSGFAVKKYQIFLQMTA